MHTLAAILLVIWPLIVVLLVLVIGRRRRRETAAEAARQEQEFLAGLTPYQREMYSLARQQASNTERAGLGIAAVIGFGGIDHE